MNADKLSAGRSPLTRAQNLQALRFFNLLNALDESLFALRSCMENQTMHWVAITTPHGILREIYLNLSHLLEPKERIQIERNFKVYNAYFGLLKTPAKDRPIKKLSTYQIVGLLLQKCEDTKVTLQQHLNEHGLMNPELPEEPYG